ncbi:MAG: hypothetical protein H6705_07305 [Myxococcales bacterium]|nr:hypothetical protein [Myxococcales bacterium]
MNTPRDLTRALAALAALTLASGCDDGAADPIEMGAGDLDATPDAAPDAALDAAIPPDMAPDMNPDMGAPLPAPFTPAALVGTWTSVECEPTMGEYLTRQITLTESEYTVFGAVFDDDACTDVMSDFVQVGTYEITGGSPLGDDIVEATFRLEHNYWIVRRASLLPGFDINDCGSEPWQANVPQDISATGCLGFAYPLSACPDGEQELIRLAGDRIATGERPLDICAERAPAIGEVELRRMPDAVTIDAPLFYPEGVAVDADRTLYIGGYTTGELRRAAFGSPTADTLVAPGALGGAALGMKIHDGALWVCATDFADPTRSALVRLDPATGAETGRYPLPGGGVCNDLTFAADGAAYVTESSRNAVLRLAPGADALDAWFTGEALPPVGDPGFGFNGLVIDDDGSLLVGRTDDGTLTRIPIADDGAPGPATIEAVEPVAVALGFDGMQRWRGGHYAIRDGRLVRLYPGDPWTTEVIADGDDFPTTFAVDRNGNAWTVESRFGLLFDGDDTTDAEPPFRVVRHPLR